jgi:hypothetical protein
MIMENLTVPNSAASALACRLIIEPRSEKSGPLPPARVELTNASQGILKIDCPSHVLEHLTFLVATQDGKVISRRKYGNLLIRARRDAVLPLQLQPGESIDYAVSLLGAIPEDGRKPGRYLVQAVYEYKTVKAFSEPVQVEFQ